mmetsp:Transcript_1716/g.4310  ORF Transcript_1716/g.4310 Transcript_1716/m.4310 type:complete len:416 (-) Transcript_1716:315-1562(-)
MIHNLHGAKENGAKMTAAAALAYPNLSATAAASLYKAAGRGEHLTFPLPSAIVVVMDLFGAGDCSAEYLAETLDGVRTLEPIAAEEPEYLEEAGGLRANRQSMTSAEGVRSRPASLSLSPAPGHNNGPLFDLPTNDDENERKGFLGLAGRNMPARSAHSSVGRRSARNSLGGNNGIDLNLLNIHGGNESRMVARGRSNALDPGIFLEFLMRRWEGARAEGFSQLLDVFAVVDSEADGSLPIAEVHRALSALAPLVTRAECAWICRDALRNSRAQGTSQAPKRAEQTLPIAFAVAAQRRGILSGAHGQLRLLHTARMSPAECAVGLAVHWRHIRTDLEAQLASVADQSSRQLAAKSLLAQIEQLGASIEIAVEQLSDSNDNSSDNNDNNSHVKGDLDAVLHGLHRVVAGAAALVGA